MRHLQAPGVAAARRESVDVGYIPICLHMLRVRVLDDPTCWSPWRPSMLREWASFGPRGEDESPRL